MKKRSALTATGTAPAAARGNRRAVGPGFPLGETLGSSVGGRAVIGAQSELKNQSIAEIAAAQRRDPLDVFLDLVVDEELNTLFALGQNNTDREAMTEFLSSPYTVVGLSDGGAHVQFHCQVGYSTRMLGYWVRERGIMPLEQAVRRLTFDSATAFGIYDRGLLQPGMAADLVVFDPDKVQPRKPEVVHDLPNNGWRVCALADGVHFTVVNGEVLIEDGNPHGRHAGSRAAQRPLSNLERGIKHKAVQALDRLCSAVLG